MQPLAQDHPFRRHADVFAKQLVQVPLASPMPVDDVVHFQDRSIGEDGIHEAVDGGAGGRSLTRPRLDSATDPAFISSLIMSLIGLALVISSIATAIASLRR